MAISTNITGSLTAAAQAVRLDVTGCGAFGVQVSGTFVGTIQFEVSGNGQIYGAVNVRPPDSSTAVTSTTAVGQWTGSCVAHTVQCRMSAWTSGTAIVAMTAIPSGGSSSGGGGAASDVNVATINGAAVSMGTGASGTGTQRVSLGDIGVGEYETVAASQTAQVLGATGGTGDYLSGVLVIPATTSPGNVLLLDNATSITIFAGGSSSVSNLVPFFIPLGTYSVSGAWKLTTGSNVSCIGIGNFT